MTFGIGGESRAVVAADFVALPPFKLVAEEGAFSVRDYPALVVAEVTVSGNQDAAANAGFKLLAGYIFGGNTPGQRTAMTAPVVQAPSAGEKIAMTAPVMQTDDGGKWSVRFVMPAGYTLQTLPTPKDARMKLLAVPPSRMAVVRFSGLANAPDVERQTAWSASPVSHGAACPDVIHFPVEAAHFPSTLSACEARVKASAHC